MKADATIFDTDDLNEPGYGGQVVATTKIGTGFIVSGNHNYRVNDVDCLTCNPPSLQHNTRRLFMRVKEKTMIGQWQDNLGYRFNFNDLVDIVILNRGEDL